jgi:hypothetical protein
MPIARSVTDPIGIAGRGIMPIDVGTPCLCLGWAKSRHIGSI